VQILLTGGGGVIGRGVIPVLLRAGHRVRLLSRKADETAREWPEGVEPYEADVTSPASLHGAADGCDRVLHVTGIVAEKDPDDTFERVNVQGTRNVVREAERAGVARLVYLSSFGVARGASAYHRSKLAAESIVRESTREWVIVRPGNVYGPGDETISALLTMVRALPAVPVVGDGRQRFQPLWYEDLGAALARAVEAGDVAGQVLELVGPDVTTPRDLIEAMARITDRKPALVPIPPAIAMTGVALAEGLGFDLPANPAKLTMLLEQHLLEPEANALGRLLDAPPTPLERGLRMLADLLPEQTPGEGVGALERKRFWADIAGSRMTARELLMTFRRECADIMPIDFESEPGATRDVEPGRTLTLRLPVRGHVQVRVEEANDRWLTFATLQGHPLAGVIRFGAETLGDRVRFMITIFAKAGHVADWLTMHTVGKPIQDLNWKIVVQRTVERSGGEAPQGVESDSATLDEDDAKAIDDWIRDRIAERKRKEAA
jgi:uncharacterized protein YbjT (DUF2867 family)